jgi:hypothetical protein
LGLDIMRFNSAQKEGLARVIDTLITSAVIGALVGVTGHSALSQVEIVCLIAACPSLYLCSYLLRGN